MSATSTVYGAIELYQDERGCHRFRLKAGARIVLESRAYKSRYGCTVGIAAVRSRAADVANFTIETAPGSGERLKLLASNHRVLGVGPCRRDVRKDLAIVQRLAAHAPLNDRADEASCDRHRRSRYRIYAAPRNARGNYHPSDASVLIVRGFQSEAERNRVLGPVHPSRHG